MQSVKKRRKKLYIWKLACNSCFASLFYYVVKPTSGEILKRDLAFYYDGTRPTEGEAVTCRNCHTAIGNPNSGMLSRVVVDKHLEEILYKLDLFDKIQQGG